MITGCGPSIFVPAAGSGGPIAARPSSVTIQGVGQTASVTLTESNTGGIAFVASGCPSSVITTSFSGPQLTITAVAGGTCTLTVTGAGSYTVTIPIVVTTTAVTGS